MLSLLFLGWQSFAGLDSNKETNIILCVFLGLILFLCDKLLSWNISY